jgi:hypothetical protein
LAFRTSIISTFTVCAGEFCVLMTPREYRGDFEGRNINRRSGIAEGDSVPDGVKVLIFGRQGLLLLHSAH